jgi:hypothetical protein
MERSEVQTPTRRNNDYLLMEDPNTPVDYAKYPPSINVSTISRAKNS